MADDVARRQLPQPDRIITEENLEIYFLNA